MKKSIFLRVVVLWVILSVSGAYSQEIKEIDLKKATSLALKEQWAELNTFLDSIPENDPNTAVLKMLKGHACLAINENDVSFCYILNVMKDSVGLQNWIAYTMDLAGKNDKSAISYYFLGDAQARFQKFEDANKSFSLAIEQDGNNYLSYNARGVVNMMATKHYEAKADFQKAIEIKKDFADAQNNLGNRTLAIMEGAKRGLEYFDLALIKNPDFSLANMGKGCLNIILNQPDSMSFQSAAKQALCINPFFIRNFDSLILTTTGNNELLLSNLINNPGTSFKVSYTTREDYNVAVNTFAIAAKNGNATKEQLNKVVTAYSGLSSQDKPDASRFFKERSTQVPEMASATNNYAPDLDKWYKVDSEFYRKAVSQAVGSGTVYGGATVGALIKKTPQSAMHGAVLGKTVDGFYQNGPNKDWQDSNSSKAKANDDLWSQTPKATKNNVGGVSQSFQGSLIEDGKWPFTPCYGLLYNLYLLKK